MGDFVNQIRSKLGLEPKRDRTVTGKIPNEIKVNRLQNEDAKPGLNPVVFAPARMNPPHAGHGEIINTVLSQAAKNGAQHEVKLTRTHQPATEKKFGGDTPNPMHPEEKLKHARRFFPNANITLAHPERPSVLHMLSDLHKQGHGHLIFVAGSSDIENYRQTISKYNGKEGPHGYYNFDKIDFVQAGEDRDPKAKGVAGLSSTKVKNDAAEGRVSNDVFPPHVTDAQKREYRTDLNNGITPPSAKAKPKRLKGGGVSEQAGYPVPVIPTPGVVDPDAQYVGDDKNLKTNDKINPNRRRAQKRIDYITTYEMNNPGVKPSAFPATSTPVPSRMITSGPVEPVEPVKAKGKPVQELFGEPSSTSSSSHGSPNYNGDLPSPGNVMYEIKPPKKKKAFKEFVILEKNNNVPTNLVPMASSMRRDFKAMRHAVNYVAPHLSKEGLKKTRAAFKGTNIESRIDDSKDGEKYDSKKEGTHFLAKDHEGHKAGTQIHITHLSHEDGTIYAHTKKHGKVPLHRVAKDPDIAKGRRAPGEYGWKVERKVAANLGSKSAKSSRHGHDFSYDIDGDGVPDVKGKIKIREKKPVVRGESKLSKAKAGIATVLWTKEKGWHYNESNQANKSMYEAFKKVRVKGEDGRHRSIIEHLNKHHSDGNAKAFSVEAPKGTTRHYIEHSDVNTLHCHDKETSNSRTYTVGNELKGAIPRMEHLSHSDIDKLDGHIRAEPQTRGVVRIAHHLKQSEMKSLSNRESGITLEDSNHAGHFLRHVTRHKKSLKEEVSLVEYVQSIISEAKQILPIKYAINHPDEIARRHARGFMYHNDMMNNIMNDRSLPDRDQKHTDHYEKLMHHVRQYERRLSQLQDSKNESVDISEARGADSKGHKRPTEQGAGLTRKGVEAYRRKNPGSKLSTAVTTPPSKLKPGSKAANRRKSFCARMGGMPGPMKDEKGRPTRKAMSLRRWNCEANEVLNALVEAKKMKGEDPCWDNYEMVGTKQKNGREVPNCVPKK